MKIPNIFEVGTPPVQYKAGEVIFAVGDEGADMYVIQAGEVDLQVREKLVETVGEGGFFGEMALIEAGPRTATAIARTDCQLVPINRSRFEFMVHEVPAFAVEVMRALSRRLRKLNELA